jgi:hypothetical protein
MQAASQQAKPSTMQQQQAVDSDGTASKAAAASGDRFYLHIYIYHIVWGMRDDRGCENIY